MGTLTDVSQTAAKGKRLGVYGPVLTGVWQKVVLTLWAILVLVCLLSFVLSIVSLNIWDRVPAAELPRYFPLLEQQAIQGRVDFQNEVRGLGFSLGVFANLLTAFRVIGSVPVFILSILLVLRYPHKLMAVLFAMLMAVVAAAGLWTNTLFGWASGLVPWMTIPGQILNLILWMGVIMLYAFPDGRFTPRWTIALAVLVIPIALALVFDWQIFLNPATWPAPLNLLPNLVFIGVAFFSVLYRYTHMTDSDRKARLKSFVTGISLLLGLYFIYFFLNDVYGTVTGNDLIQTMRGLVLFILITEPLWFVVELIYAWLASRSFFRDKLLEG